MKHNNPFDERGFLRDGFWHRWVAMRALGLIIWPILGRPLLKESTHE